MGSLLQSLLAIARVTQKYLAIICLVLAGVSFTFFQRDMLLNRIEKLQDAERAERARYEGEIAILKSELDAEKRHSEVILVESHEKEGIYHEKEDIYKFVISSPPASRKIARQRLASR